MSRALEILNAPWVIAAHKLVEIQAIYTAHCMGPKIDIPDFEAKTGVQLSNEQKGYQVDRLGIARIGVDGVLAPKMNLFTKISGGSSTQILSQQVAAAAADPMVVGLLLEVDSPGGSVHGTPELAAAIRSAADKKPVATLSDVQMCSGAYWAGSAAHSVYITGPTVQVGSIGVVATHNYSPDRSGGKTTEITAGKYKRIASSERPLDDEGRAYIQDQVDHIYEVFAGDVASNRGVSVDDVLEHMADGRVFTGQQAIDAGLVDGVSTADALSARMASDPQAFMTRRGAQIKAKQVTPSERAGAAAEDTTTAVQAADPPSITGDSDMADPITRASLEKDNAPLFAEVLALGASAERDRIAAVRAQSMPGHEKLIEALAADGKSTGADAALAVLAAIKTQTSAAAAAHAADAPVAAARVAAPADEASEKTDEMKAAEAKAYAVEHRISFAAAVKALGFRL